MQRDGEVERLIEVLAQAPVGGTVTFEALDRAIGSKIRDRRYLLARACEMMNKANGSLFVNVHDIGMRRLPIEEAPAKVGAHGRRKIKRAARRIVRRLTNAIAAVNDADPVTFRAIGQEVAIAGMVASVAAIRPPGQKKPSGPAPRPEALAARMIEVVTDLRRKPKSRETAPVSQLELAQRVITALVG
jgi:hypothetical protein